MTTPKCAVCGRVNRVGAAVCEMCDTRFGDPSAAGSADPSRAGWETSGGFDAAGEGFIHEGESPHTGALPTDIPSPQFKGASDVISPTLEIYRKNFLLVGLLVLATTLPQAVLQYAAASSVGSGVFEGEGSGDLGPGGLAVVMGGMGNVLYWLLMLLGNAVLSGALAYAVVSIQRTGAAGAGAGLRWGLRKMLKVFAVTVVTSLLVYAAPVVLVVVLSLILGPVAIIGFLLMLLPWIIMTLMLSLAAPAAAIENRSIIGSLTRSAELTKGHKGLLFLTYFVWWIVIIVLNFVVSGSFAFGGASDTLPSLLVQTVIGGMLNSSMFVLTVYIFLGILNERRQGFATRAFTPGPEAAAR